MVSYTANTEIRDIFLSNLLLLTLFDDVFFLKKKVKVQRGSAAGEYLKSEWRAGFNLFALSSNSVLLKS